MLFLQSLPTRGNLKVFDHLEGADFSATFVVRHGMFMESVPSQKMVALTSTRIGALNRSVDVRSSRECILCL